MIKNNTIVTDKIYDNYIFVSDIHGNLPTIALIKKARAKYPNAMFVAGGDYIDSRNNSKEVMDYLMDISQEDNVIILKGNHEQLMLNFVDGLDDYDGSVEPLWYVNGGKRTVKSFFGRKFSKSVNRKMIRTSKYYQFVKDLPIMYDTPNIIFVHAGVKPVKDYDNPDIYPDDAFDPNDNSYDYFRIWARREYVCADNYPYFAHNETGKVIVTGHTPTSLIDDVTISKGMYDQTLNFKQIKHRPFTKNIVFQIQYPNEPARIFCDGGCHSHYKQNNGNVVVLDKQGKVVEVFR